MTWVRKILKASKNAPPVIGSHDSPLTKHREWNIQRPRPGIDDGSRQSLAAGSLSGLWPGTKLILLVFMELQRSPKSVHEVSNQAQVEVEAKVEGSLLYAKSPQRGKPQHI